MIDPINSRYFHSQGKMESFHLAISVCTSHYWMKSKHVCFSLLPGLRRLHICIFLSICTSQHQNPSCTWSHSSFCKWAFFFPTQHELWWGEGHCQQICQRDTSQWLMTSQMKAHFWHVFCIHVICDRLDTLSEILALQVQHCLQNVCKCMHFFFAYLNISKVNVFLFYCIYFEPT